MGLLGQWVTGELELEAGPPILFLGKPFRAHALLPCYGGSGVTFLDNIHTVLQFLFGESQFPSLSHYHWQHLTLSLKILSKQCPFLGAGTGVPELGVQAIKTFMRSFLYQEKGVWRPDLLGSHAKGKLVGYMPVPSSET